jgi:hypothetical protein
MTVVEARKRGATVQVDRMDIDETGETGLFVDPSGALLGAQEKEAGQETG